MAGAVTTGAGIFVNGSGFYWDSKYYLCYANNAAAPNVQNVSLVYDFKHDHLYLIPDRHISGYVTTGEAAYVTDGNLMYRLMDGYIDDTETHFACKFRSGWIDVQKFKENRMREIWVDALLSGGGSPTLTVIFETPSGNISPDPYALVTGRTKIQVAAGTRLVNRVKFQLDALALCELKGIMLLYDPERP